MKVIKRDSEDSVGWAHWCPNCNEHHVFITWRKNTGSGPLWTFNNNLEKPSFSPSMKISGGDGDGGWKVLCHYILTDGAIMYCADFQGKYMGKIIELPDLPYYPGEIPKVSEKAPVPEIPVVPPDPTKPAPLGSKWVEIKGVPVLVPQHYEYQEYPKTVYGVVVNNEDEEKAVISENEVSENEESDDDDEEVDESGEDKSKASETVTDPAVVTHTSDNTQQQAPTTTPNVPKPANQQSTQQQHRSQGTAQGRNWPRRNR